MPTVPLPSDPNIEHLRNQARDLQRAVRAHDAEALAHVEEHLPGRRAAGDQPTLFPLQLAQATLARHYGFTSWASLKRHVEVILRLTRTPDLVDALAEPADEFLRLACLNYGNDGPQRWSAARRMLDEEPGLATANVFTAAATASVHAVERFLAADEGAASVQGGPFRWTPLMYLAYARHDPAIDAEAVLAVARALLRAGADPNAGYLWHGLPTPFTVLTGVFGEGEQGVARQPRHPHEQSLARALLEAGADPNDGQALYNRMFEPDDSHLGILFEFGLGTGTGGPWRALIGSALYTPPELVRTQLRWAATHRQRDRVRLLLEHGVDLQGSFDDNGTIADLAALSPDRDIVADLVAAGAPPPRLSPEDAFVAAALQPDMNEVETLTDADPTLLRRMRRRRPSLVMRAAVHHNHSAVRYIVALGFDVNAFGRADVALEQQWETPLHHAAHAGDQSMAEVLMSLGADTTLRDRRFDGTPLDWAAHAGQADLVLLLAPLTEPDHASERGDG